VNWPHKNSRNEWRNEPEELLEEKEAIFFIPQVKKLLLLPLLQINICLYYWYALMAPKLVDIHSLEYCMKHYLKKYNPPPPKKKQKNRGVRYRFLRYFIQFEIHPEAKLMWRKQLSFPPQHFLSLSFCFGSLIIFSSMPSELSDHRFLCDRDLLGDIGGKKNVAKI